MKPNMKEVNIEGKFGKFSLSLPEELSESDMLKIHNMITPLLNGDNVSNVIASFMPGHNDCEPSTYSDLKYQIRFNFSSPRSFEKLKAASALRKAFPNMSLKESKDIVDGVKDLSPIYGEEVYHLSSIFRDKGVISYSVEPVIVEV